MVRDSLELKSNVCALPLIELNTVQKKVVSEVLFWEMSAPSFKEDTIHVWTVTLN